METPPWNKSTRESLRDTLKTIVVGETRLAKSSGDEILQICREWIEEDCPEGERDTFLEFARGELKVAQAEHLRTQASWPAVTDSDRMDQVQVALRERGIVLWQASPCCDTCTMGEIYDHIEALDKKHPGLLDKLRGCAFFIDQNLADELSEDTEVTVFLAYGWFSADDKDVKPKVYEKHAMEIANEVVACFKEHGFKPDWDGSFSRKIGIPLNWQRRTPLPD